MNEKLNTCMQLCNPTTQQTLTNSNKLQFSNIFQGIDYFTLLIILIEPKYPINKYKSNMEIPEK